MLVRHSILEQVINEISTYPEIGFDTETYGLRYFHGDRLFSIAIAVSEDKAFYFNFKDYPDENLSNDAILSKEKTFSLLQNYVFNDKTKLFFAHNAKFDMHMLANENVFIKGIVHCTKAIGRCVYNAHNSYHLSDSLSRIGLEKDDAVEKYIEEHGLKLKESVPGKKQTVTKKFFDRVPFSIIFPYAEKDAIGTLLLGKHQLERIQTLDERKPIHLAPLSNLLKNERRLTKTTFEMERIGCKIDRKFCISSIKETAQEINSCLFEIEELTGESFVDSSKHLERIFRGHESEFSFTSKNNPSFKTECLEKISHPLVSTLIKYRHAKARLNFYQGFIYHADANDIVHTSFNTDTAIHGRMSSSNPNFQNLKRNEESGEVLSEQIMEQYCYDADAQDEVIHDLSVRKAIIPRNENIFLMPDYSSMEYRLALELTCIYFGRTVKLAQMVLDGMDVHDATVDLVKAKGSPINRSMAKITNFLSLYGGGAEALSTKLKCDKKTAVDIQNAINAACPEMTKFREVVRERAKKVGYITNWFGRRCYFPDPSKSFRAPNYLISGGCADIMKLALNNIGEEIKEKNLSSKLVSVIHDEAVLECTPSEVLVVSEIAKRCMKTAYPHKHVPMVADMCYSKISMGDKIEGEPT